MVALSTVIAPTQNRVGDFFSWSFDCAGETGTQVPDCDWEIEAVSTTPRRGNSLTKKEWTPNKDDCASLATNFPNHYDPKPGHVYGTSEDAQIAASISNSLAADTRGWTREFGGSIYRTYDYDLGSGYAGFSQATRTHTGYSFTRPTVGGRPNKDGQASWNGISRWRTWGKDNVGYYHSHLGSGAGSEQFSGEKGDNGFVQNNGVFLNLTTVSGRLRILRPSETRTVTDQFGNTMELTPNNTTKYGDVNGNPVFGSISAPNDAQRNHILDCRRAGF